MKNHTLISMVLVVTFYSAALAQTVETVPIKRITIKEIYIQTGFFSERSSSGTLKEFQRLAPTSTLLQKDFTGYSASQGLSLNSNTMFSVVLGFQFRDEEKNTYKSNPLLRLGFSYFSGNTVTGSLYKEDRKRYDTLTSAQTGQTIFSDSVTSRSTNMNYNYQQLRFDLSLIFRTNTAARWSLFAGVGVSAGLSINATTQIYSSKSSRTETPNNGNSASSYSSYGGEWVSEIIRNKNNLGLSAYIPMGVDFRIGNKREFWKRTHLFYELRPGITVTSIPELTVITNASLQQGIGLKVAW